MRPQWGFSWEEVRRSGLDILIAIDTSKSMLAGDIKPNRLERSKLAVKDLIKKLRGDRIGLIAFSGNAFLQCPLTVDYSGFLLSLNELNFNSIPKGGTSISSAIKTAMDSYEGGQKKYKILVIITDGEDHEGNVAEMAEKAKDAGIKIFSIGIGTKEGELISVTDESGNKVFLKDRQGNVVKTRLDETTLQKIALTTGGSYVRATNTEFGLDLIYEEKLSKMEKREIESNMIKRYEERFQIPLAIALVLLCLEPFISERRRSERV
jgi:Ca-activated chloride channel family protein